MLHPLLYNKWRILLFAGFWLTLGLLQAVALSSFVQLSFGWLLLDGLVYSVLFGFISLLVLMVVKYARLLEIRLEQRIVSISVLGVLSLSSWIGLGLFILYSSVPKEVFDVLLSLTPLQAFIGILFMLGIIQKGQVVMQAENLEQAADVPIEESQDVDLTENSELAEETLERIAVKLGQKIHVVNVPDIIYLQAEGDYVMIHSPQGQFLKEQTMKYFEQHLPSNKFVRVHRSYIVNVEKISRIELYEKQSQLLTLQNGQQIKASAGGYRLLKQTLSL